LKEDNDIGHLKNKDKATGQSKSVCVWKQTAKEERGNERSKKRKGLRSCVIYFCFGPSLPFFSVLTPASFFVSTRFCESRPSMMMPPLFLYTHLALCVWLCALLVPVLLCVTMHQIRSILAVSTHVACPLSLVFRFPHPASKFFQAQSNPFFDECLRNTRTDGRWTMGGWFTFLKKGRGWKRPEIEAVERR